MGTKTITTAKRRKGEFEDIQSITIQTDYPTPDHKETLVTFFLWCMEHDGVTKELMQ